MADRSFVPAVAAGLAGSALMAVAGTRTWAEATGETAGLRVESAVTGSETAPLAAALALVALAAWGVVLVVRGGIRRVVATVGAVASLAGLVAVVAAFGSARDAAVEALIGQGAAGSAAEATASLTGWYYSCALGALAAAGALLVAAVRAPGWPAMGTRYDAPATRAEEPVTDEDIWRALDRGHDPTS